MIISFTQLPSLYEQSTNKDTRLLAGTAVAMLVNTAPNENAARMAALSLLHLTRTGDPHFGHYHKFIQLYLYSPRTINCLKALYRAQSLDPLSASTMATVYQLTKVNT